jgi:DNA end-binding protein Ku
VRDAAAYFEDVEAGKPDAKLLALIERLIDERSEPWSPDMVEDPVQQRLLEIIEDKKRKSAKASRRGRVAPPPETPTNVVSIMDALRKSLEAERKPGR